MGHHRKNCKKMAVSTSSNYKLKRVFCLKSIFSLHARINFTESKRALKVPHQFMHALMVLTLSKPG